MNDDKMWRHQDMYNESGGFGGAAPLILNPDLSDSLLEWEKKIRKFARGGLVIVTGMPGAGKDLFANCIAYLIKTIYADKKVFRDERPKGLFGEYELFNEKTLMEDLRRMSTEALGMPSEIGRSDQEAISGVRRLTEEWMQLEGEVKLQNSVLYLTEFWRYCHNRRPHNPMGILLGGIIKQRRHLDLLIIGTAQQLREIDRISVHPYITHNVKCKWSMKHRNTGQYKIFEGTITGAEGIWQCGRKRVRLAICGSKPRAWLDGGCVYDLYVSKSKPQIIMPGG